MPLLLFPLIIFTEIFLAVKIFSYFGFIDGFLIYLAPSFLGVFFLKWKAPKFISKAQQGFMQSQNPPLSFILELGQILGGLLLIIPSIVLRILAILLLFPLTRFLLSHWLKIWWLGKLAKGGFKFFTNGGFAQGGFFYSTNNMNTTQNEREVFSQNFEIPASQQIIDVQAKKQDE